MLIKTSSAIFMLEYILQTQENAHLYLNTWSNSETSTDVNSASALPRGLTVTTGPSSTDLGNEGRCETWAYPSTEVLI